MPAKTRRPRPSAAHSARRRPVQGDRTAKYTSDSNFPGSCMPSRSRRRSPTAGSSARHVRRRENARRARSSIAQTSDQSSVRSGTGFEGIWRAPPTIRRRRHPLLRAVRSSRRRGNLRDRQSRRRCGAESRTRRKSRTSRPISKPTTNPTWSSPRSARSTGCKASAATPSRVSKAPVKLDETYVTPTEIHNPIELHATTAMWDGSTLTLYETTQGVVNLRGVLAQMFGLSKENVRVISKFLGSGFGGKLWPWTHTRSRRGGARARQAREARRQPEDDVPDGRPSPPHAATRAPGRHPRRQARLAAARLHLPAVDARCPPRRLRRVDGIQYSVPNLRVTFGRARRNIGATADMRGPGPVPGLYATEAAMNELADQLKIDPVQLRIINEPKIDEALGIPFSSRHFVECFGSAPRSSAGPGALPTSAR